MDKHLLLKDHILKVTNVIRSKRVRRIFGTIPDDLKSELRDLGFIEKETFEIMPKKLSLIEMKTFSFWEI